MANIEKQGITSWMDMYPSRSALGYAITDS